MLEISNCELAICDNPCLQFYQWEGKKLANCIVHRQLDGFSAVCCAQRLIPLLWPMNQVLFFSHLLTATQLYRIHKTEFVLGGRLARSNCFLEERFAQFSL